MVGGPSREAQRQSGDQIGLALTYAPNDASQLHKVPEGRVTTVQTHGSGSVTGRAHTRNTRG